MPRLLISTPANPVFTDRKRKVFRKKISNGEIAFSAAFVVFVFLMAVWFFTKKDDYNPAERDIAMSVLEQDVVRDTLYRRPLKLWADPAATAGGAPAGPALGAFPVALLDGGWEPSSRVQQFDPTNMWEKINGAADQYIQFGVVALHYVSIKSGEADISIELYDMGSMQNALGIFGAQKDEYAEVTNENGVSYYLTGAGAIGTAGQYYFKAAGNAENELINEKGKQLVAVFAGMGAASGNQPRPYQILATDLGVPSDAIEFAKSDVFQYAFAKDFWFGSAGAAPNFRYYIHEAANPDAATTLYIQLLENNLFDYDEISRTENSVVLKHKFLNTYLSLVQADAMVFGVDGAPETAALEEATAKLRGALEGNGDEAEAYSAS